MPKMIAARHMPLTEFRARLSAVLKTNVAAEREHVILENNGVPLAVVVSMNDYETLFPPKKKGS